MKQKVKFYDGEWREIDLVLSHEQVHELPPTTVLRDADGYAWYRGTGSWVGAGGTGLPYFFEWEWTHEALPLPAQVLWRPVDA